MKSNLQHKLLLALSKSKKDKGFTLIELLVVIIIIGVLSAVALPNLLGQVGKARESEGKTNVGAILRSQQAYRLEEGEFASNLEDLDTSIEGEFYSYSLSDADTRDVIVNADEETDFEDDIRGFEGGASQPADGNFTSIICQDGVLEDGQEDAEVNSDFDDCTTGEEVN